MSNPTLITIVVPVYNEEDNVSSCYQRLADVADRVGPEYEFEFLFTDNHSDDKTLDKLRDLVRLDDRVRVLRFSRNFGFQRSIMTGYLNARGSAAIQIDCDLQDPPELIPEFLAKWREGYEVVYGIRRSRQEGRLITLMRRLFYRLIDWLSDDVLPHDAGDFRLIGRPILDALALVDDYHPYVRGLIASFGFRQTGILYDRGKREQGESKFPLRRLVALAIDGILLHSVVPLRVATLTGLVTAGVMLAGIVVYTVGRVVFDQAWPAGFATTTVLLLVSIVLNALFLGVIGEYLGRIYQQVKRRPLTIIEQVIDSSSNSIALPESEGMHKGPVVGNSEWSHEPHRPRRPIE